MKRWLELSLQHHTLSGVDPLCKYILAWQERPGGGRVAARTARVGVRGQGGTLASVDAN